MNQIQASADLQGAGFWSRVHVISTLKTTLALLPSVAIWYLLVVQGMSVFLGFKSSSTLWEVYSIFHILAGLVILLLTVFIARVSERAKSQNKFRLFAISLFGSLFLILLSPTGWGWIALLFLGLSAVIYWLTPWNKVITQFQPFGTHAGSTIAVVLQITETIIRLPYTEIRAPMLNLLKDFLAKIDNEENLHKKAQLERFALDFSEYIKPLLGALSYRSKTLKNDAPELMQFIERYPPFPPNKRSFFNSPAYLLKAVLEDEKTKETTKILWLKSALILANQVPKTLNTTLGDIELFLLSLLLEKSEHHEQEIKDLLIRFMQRFHNTDFKLNVFQQNSWLNVLEKIRDLPDENNDIRRKWCGYQYHWPDFAKSYAHDTFSYSKEREEKLKILTKTIWTKVDGSDTGPSLIGIKSDLWKMGLMDENDDLNRLTSHEVTKQFTDSLQVHSKGIISQQFLSVLLGEYRYVLYEFIKTIPENYLAEFLALLTEDSRKQYYQAMNKQFDLNIEAHFEALVKAINPQTIDETPLLELLLRYLRAGNHQAQLILRQIDEFEASNYIQDHERYEYDIENKLNQASLHRVDHIEGLFTQILQELKSDIEASQTDLQAFVDHLGYKFGALIYSMNACFSNEVFVWFLQTTQNKNSLIETEAIKNHYYARIMMEAISFHQTMLQGNKEAAFNALNQLFILHSVRYPLNNKATQACLVSCMEIMSQTKLPAENVQAFLDALSALPKNYPNLTPEKQAELQEIIKLAIAKYKLIENPQLTQNQKSFLSRFMIGAETL
ncbi:hypothetical protein JCM30760_01440 [Thiomicrorhabdus hydrogeniphila]